MDFEIAAPATEQAMTDVELALGYSLPQEFREVLTNFSSRLKSCWFLPEDYELPEEISEIMSGELDWDLSNLVDLNQSVKRIIKIHFTDDDGPIGIIWREKLAFHETVKFRTFSKCKDRQNGL